jgi:hypothetical protein
VEGFLSGFKLAPKPLKGVELTVATYSLVTKATIKEVLVSLTSAQGLSSWLGETSQFLAHIGIKFETVVEGESSKCVITTLDLPKRIVFMVEAIGEFDFAISQNTNEVLVALNIRRAVQPSEAKAWKDSLAPMVQRLEKVLRND